MVANSALGVFSDVILPVFTVAIIGGFVGRRLGLQLETLQRATFFLFSPALVFNGLASTDLKSGVLARLSLVSVVVFTANALIGILWARIRGVDPPAAAAIAVAGAVPNQGNMGLPMALLAFGRSGLEIATVLFVIGTLLSSSAAVALAKISLRQGGLREALVAPLRFPAIYAGFAGIVVNATGIDLPIAVGESVGTLAQASIPVMLIILGMSFQLPRSGDYVDPLFISANRLLAGPAMACLALAMVGVEGPTRGVVIMMSGMPVAVNTTILARQLRADVGVAVRAVVISTIISLVSLSALLAALR